MGSDQAATPSHQAGLASPEYSIPVGMAQGQFKAMGTTVTTLLPEARADAVEIVRSLFAEWERVLSRFLPESELSWLNAHPGQNVITSPLFSKVLASSLNAAQATQGIYDPTLLDQMVKIGYDRSFDTLSPTLPASSYDGQPALPPPVRSGHAEGTQASHTGDAGGPLHPGLRHLHDGRPAAPRLECPGRRSDRQRRQHLTIHLLVIAKQPFERAFRVGIHRLVTGHADAKRPRLQRRGDVARGQHAEQRRARCVDHRHARDSKQLWR